MSARRESGIATAIADLKPAQKGRRHVAPEPRGPGRPPGKKSNPDYRQHSVWLRRTTHQTALAHLRAANPDTADFSELVETLVAAWNSKQMK